MSQNRSDEIALALDRNNPQHAYLSSPYMISMWSVPKSASTCLSNQVLSGRMSFGGSSDNTAAVEKSAGIHTPSRATHK